MMPIDPSAWANTPALVHASITSASVPMRLFLSPPRPLYRSFDRDGIRQGGEHPRDPRVVRRLAVDVTVDRPEPSPEVVAWERGARRGPVKEQVHLGRRALAPQ